MLTFGDMTMELPTLPLEYEPSDQEAYMSPLHLAYFQRELLKWKQSLIDQSDQTLQSLAKEAINTAEAADRASLETNKAFELRTRDRARKLIGKIDRALQRIEEGAYGYCEETGNEIGLARLKARPIATMTIEVQEVHERDEKLRRV